MTGNGDLLASQLVTWGYGQTASTPPTIFVGELPGTAPDECIVVRELPGEKPVKAMGVKSVLDQPDFQVLVRKNGNAAGYTALLAAVNGIKNQFDGWSGTIGGKRFHWVELAYEPVYMGRDENRRHSTSIVFHVKRER